MKKPITVAYYYPFLAALICFAVGAYMIINEHVSSVQLAGKYGKVSENTLNGYGAIFVGIVFLIFGVVFRYHIKKGEEDQEREEFNRELRRKNRKLKKIT